MKEVTIDKILEIINANVENNLVSKNQLDEDLSAFGMDSIIFIRIVVSVEEEFECEVPDSKLLITEMNTVNKIYDVLNSITSETIE